MNRRVVIKIGTQALINKDGELQTNVMEDIINEVVKLKQSGHKVIIVSSGAIGLGKSVLNKAFSCFVDKTLRARVAFTLGMPQLMHVYHDAAQKHGYWCPQLLLTRRDFSSRADYVRMMNLFEGLLSQDELIPIINENDAVASPESMFTDNDELAGLVAAQIRANKLIIVTSVDGVYDKNPEDPTATLLREITPEIVEMIETKSKSEHGRGGMQNKLNTSLKVAKLGIDTIIMHVNKRHMIAHYNDPMIGTQIRAHKAVSSFKRWLSFSQGVAGIYVNEDFTGLLESKHKAVSILPVAVNGIEGKFSRDDVIFIMNPKGKIIAVGVAEYSNQTLKKNLGQPNKDEVVHCNQLFVY